MLKKSLFFVGAMLLLFVALLFWPVDVTRATASPTLLAADGSLLRAYPAADGQIRLPVVTDDVDPEFIRLLKAIEDKRYDWHPGFDPFALTRAFYQWGRTGSVVSGGSTLTMQVARLLSPAPRTLHAKCAEIWRSMRLTVQFNKNDILNFYLQLAPYGGNIAGVRTASLVYFGKEPKKLTPDESALLIALPQNPNMFRPDRFAKGAMKARAKILQRLVLNKEITQTAYKAGLAMSIPTIRHPLPMHALHLAEKLVLAKKETAPWHSTIDALLQTKIENLLHDQLNQLPAHATIAAMVVDNQTREVRAYIGSADYFAHDRAGSVDIVSAIRSPGSTLKPFVYGMAFQDGFATPETIIRDEPTHFGSYTPSNFDQGYRGQVTLREALQQSLNIPAVKVLNQVGTERWLATLRATGAQLKLPDKQATAQLPIILGGLGTSLWDLTMLYVGLANDGQVAPLDILQNHAPHKEIAVMTPFAAQQITDILIGSPLSTGVMRSPRLSELAVKTGTSYGYRDAWAIGYTPRYTVSVWVGRADGSSVPDQAGRKTAVPILLGIYDLISLPTHDHFHFAMTKNNSPQLQYWIGDRVKSFAATPESMSSLKITYPVNNAKYIFDEIDAHGIKLTAEGGNKPYQWYVNGLPLTNVYWKPNSAGFYKITVQDDDGHVAEDHVTIN